MKFHPGQLEDLIYNSCLVLALSTRRRSYSSTQHGGEESLCVKIQARWIIVCLTATNYCHMMNREKEETSTSLVTPWRKDLGLRHISTEGYRNVA